MFLIRYIVLLQQRIYESSSHTRQKNLYTCFPTRNSNAKRARRPRACISGCRLAGRHEWHLQLSSKTSRAANLPPLPCDGNIPLWLTFTDMRGVGRQHTRLSNIFCFVYEQMQVIDLSSEACVSSRWFSRCYYLPVFSQSSLFLKAHRCHRLLWYILRIFNSCSYHNIIVCHVSRNACNRVRTIHASWLGKATITIRWGTWFRLNSPTFICIYTNHDMQQLHKALPYRTN